MPLYRFRRQYGRHIYTPNRRRYRRRLRIGRGLRGVRRAMYRINRKINYYGKRNRPEVRTQLFSDSLQVNTDGTYTVGGSNVRFAPTLDHNGDNVYIKNIRLYGMFSYALSGATADADPAYLRLVILKYNGQTSPLSTSEVLPDFVGLPVSSTTNPANTAVARYTAGPLRDNITDRATVIFNRYYKIDADDDSRIIKINLRNIGVYNPTLGQDSNAGTKNQIHIFAAVVSTNYIYPASFGCSFKVAYTDA